VIADLEARSEPGGDPPLVFLHEGLGSAALWRGFPDAVRHATGDPAMLVYSRHGYGRSGPAAMPRPVDYMHHEADVVLPALLAARGIDRPVLVGHSDGASIALLYAGAGHPVAALVLLAPHVFVEDVSVSSIAAIAETYRTTDLRRRLARHHDDVDAAFWGWNDIWLDPAFRHWNIESLLGSIRAPVLVVQGHDDEYGTMAQVDHLAAQVPQAEVLKLGACRHSPHRDQPDAVTTATIDFVRRHGAAAAGPRPGDARP
jgi:pimeloyl-ACP methyl ester carboxylesterase